MTKIQQRNRILNMILIGGIIIGLYLTDLSNGKLLGIFSTIALLSGFANVYFTTKRSIKFIVPDMIWIFFTIMTLIMTNNFSDMYLYIFYIFIGFYQYTNWKNNQDDNLETVIIPFKISDFLYACGYGLAISTLVYMISPENSSNLVLGSLITGVGITASYYLAKRYFLSEVLYVLVNLSQIGLFIVSDLYQLALIPLVFLLNGFVFIYFNRK